MNRQDAIKIEGGVRFENTNSPAFVCEVSASGYSAMQLIGYGGGPGLDIHGGSTGSGVTIAPGEAIIATATATIDSNPQAYPVVISRDV